MKVWFLYAILGIITIGIFSFISNIISKKGRNKDIFLFYTSFLALLISIIFLFIKGSFSALKDFNLILYAFMVSFFYILGMNFKMTALKYIDSVIFFPILKIIRSIILIPIGVYFFKDPLNIFNILGVTFSILGNILLMDKTEHKRQKNLKKGIFLAIVLAFIMFPKVPISKILTISYNISEIYGYVFVNLFFCTLFSLIKVLLNKKIKKEDFKISKKDFGIFFIASILLYSTIPFYVFSYEGANLFVVNIISSFSIIITIFLSVIFLKEHINIKKFLAIILFITSDWHSFLYLIFHK